MNQKNAYVPLAQDKALTRRTYEAPQVIRLDDVVPETGTKNVINENTNGGMFSTS